MKKMINSFLIIISLAVVVNAQVDYETEIQPIFNSSCTNCHGNSGGLSLSSYSNLMSTNVIVAGDHAASIPRVPRPVSRIAAIAAIALYADADWGPRKTRIH